MNKTKQKQRHKGEWWGIYGLKGELRYISMNEIQWDSMRINESWFKETKKHVIIRKMDTEWIFDNIKELLLMF